MINRHQIEQQAHALRQQEISRLTHEFVVWFGTQLRTRHEAALRKPACGAGLPPANATPV